MEDKKIFDKILVALDGGLPSLVASELTVFLAKRLDSEVTVIHVVSHEFMNPEVQKFFVPTYEYAPIGVMGAEEGQVLQRVPKRSEKSIAVAEKITESYHKKGEAIIGDAVSLFKDEDIPVDKIIVEHADPADTIINEAAKGSYGLIVIGHSGEEQQESHLGSVVKKVAQHARTPVLIAKEKRKISKILVPVDGSKNAEKALKYAALLAKKTNAKLALLTVQESHLFRLRPDITKEVGNRILTNAVNLVTEIKPDQKLESGDPGKTIAQMAEKEDYDIIIMGSRGHGDAKRFLLGSVSDHVIHHANCSVLIVK